VIQLELVTVDTDAKHTIANLVIAAHQLWLRSWSVLRELALDRRLVITESRDLDPKPKRALQQQQTHKQCKQARSDHEEAHVRAAQLSKRYAHAGLPESG
jgi:hypothetical protein